MRTRSGKNAKCGFVAGTELPFRLNRSQKRSLVDQMADGLRNAIVTGYFKPGDTLPTILEWTRMLGCSIRVPEGAMAKLADEGLVSTRPRHGTTVLGSGRMNWRGHVLLVRLLDSTCHFIGERIAAAEEHLSKSGYLTTTIVVRRDDGGRLDLSHLEFEMKRNVCFTIVFGHIDEVLRSVSASGIPFVDFAAGQPLMKGCVGHIDSSVQGAVREFAAHCRRSGVGKALIVSKTNDMPYAREALEEEGITFSEMVLEAQTGPDRMENLQREGCAAFDGMFAREGRGWLPDVIFVTDDYVATGVLFSLFSHGVRIPEDTGFVTVKNKGNGPALPFPLTCVECSPSEVGRETAAAVMRVLDGKPFSFPESEQVVYLKGESFR